MFFESYSCNGSSSDALTPWISSRRYEAGSHGHVLLVVVRMDWYPRMTWFPVRPVRNTADARLHLAAADVTKAPRARQR